MRHGAGSLHPTITTCKDWICRETAGKRAAITQQMRSTTSLQRKSTDSAYHIVYMIVKYHMSDVVESGAAFAIKSYGVSDKGPLVSKGWE
jgi:hypothetical protein